MARKQKITRTIKTESVNVLCLNREDNTTSMCVLQTVNLPSADTKAIKKLKEHYNSDATEVIAILSRVPLVTKYEISIEDFIAHSTPIESTKE